jgi:hypothetical protein
MSADLLSTDAAVGISGPVHCRRWRQHGVACEHTGADRAGSRVLKRLDRLT